VAPAYLLTLLENMQPLMTTLLQCGANANLMAPPNVVSPLYYLMRVVCSMSPSLLGATAEQVSSASYPLWVVRCCSPVGQFATVEQVSSASYPLWVGWC